MYGKRIIFVKSLLYNKLGFTLVELSLVIAIIAIITAIAIYQVYNYKQSAANSKCAQEMTTCILQTTLSLTDNVSFSTGTNTCNYGTNSYTVTITNNAITFSPFACPGGGTCAQEGNSVVCKS